MESDFFFKALYDYSQLVTIVHCLDFSVDTDAYTGLYLDQPWQQHHRGRNHAMQGQWFGGCGMTYAFRTTSAMKTWWILRFFSTYPTCCQTCSGTVETKSVQNPGQFW